MNPQTSPNPRWIRPADCRPITGLTRSHIYQLIGEGRIKSRVLKRAGTARGVRLIDVRSLLDFIESLPEDAA